MKEDTDYLVWDFLQKNPILTEDFLPEELDSESIFLNTVNLRLMLSLYDPEERIKWFPSCSPQKGVDGQSLENRIVIGASNFVFDLRHGIFRNNNVLSYGFYTPDGKIILTQDLPDFNTPYPILRMLTMSRKTAPFYHCDDLESAHSVDQHLGIDINCPYRTLDIEKYGFCRSWIPYQPGDNQIIFENQSGSPIFGVRSKVNLPSILLSPSIGIYKQNEIYPCQTVLMPSTPLPLFRLGKLTEEKTKPVIITDSILRANEFWKRVRATGFEETTNFLVTSWFSGIDGIEHTDWSPLYHRKIYYFLPHSNPEDDVKKNLEIAFSVYKYLLDQVGADNLRFRIIDYDRITNKIYRPEHFFELCEKWNVTKPEYIHDFNAELHNADQCNVNRKITYLINPIIAAHSLSVLFAPSGVGKSWLSLSMGIALSSGKDVCSKWQVPESKTVLYVAGEMGDAEINNRIVKIKKSYPSYSCDFYYKITHEDLGSTAGQMEIETYLRYLKTIGKNVAFLILDNLNSLVTNGEYKSTWDSFFHWLTSIQKKYSPLACMIVHHTNKGGDALGTSAIKKRIDLMLKAQNIDPLEEQIARIKGEDDRKSPLDILRERLEKQFQNEIPMFISFEKVRSLSKQEALPFWMTFDPEHANLGWRVREPEYLREFNLVPKTLKEDVSAAAILSAELEAIYQKGNIPITIGGEKNNNAEEISQFSDDLANVNLKNENLEKQGTSGNCDLNQDQKQKFRDMLVEKIAGIGLNRSWRSYSPEEKYIISNFYREIHKMSASKISEKYNVTLRTIQTALNDKKFKNIISLP